MEKPGLPGTEIPIRNCVVRGSGHVIFVIGGVDSGTPDVPHRADRFGLWKVDTKDEATVWCLVGAVLLLLCFHLVNGLAYLWGRFARIMLGSQPPAGV